MTMSLYKKNISHPGFIVFNFEARFDKKSDNSAVIFNFVQNILGKPNFVSNEVAFLKKDPRQLIN